VPTAGRIIIRAYGDEVHTCSRGDGLLLCSSSSFSEDCCEKSLSESFGLPVADSPYHSPVSGRSIASQSGNSSANSCYTLRSDSDSESEDERAEYARMWSNRRWDVRDSTNHCVDGGNEETRMVDERESDEEGMDDCVVGEGSADSCFLGECAGNCEVDASSSGDSEEHSTADTSHHSLQQLTWENDGHGSVSDEEEGNLCKEHHSEVFVETPPRVTRQVSAGTAPRQRRSQYTLAISPEPMRDLGDVEDLEDQDQKRATQVDVPGPIEDFQACMPVPLGKVNNGEAEAVNERLCNTSVRTMEHWRLFKSRCCNTQVVKVVSNEVWCFVLTFLVLGLMPMLIILWQPHGGKKLPDCAMLPMWHYDENPLR